ncbi:CoA transferase [Novosphingobium decolorationis]
MSEHGRQGPLAGIKVIDLTAMVMGPYATQIMADMGAQVIKIEPPEGDGTRFISVGPEPGMGGVFAHVNRGKRSHVMDLSQDAARAQLLEMIAEADVFIHSMRGRAIARLGLDYAAVSRVNPGIVYTNCYGYGRKGRYRDQAAYDDTIQAECGLTSVQELLNGEPGFVGSIMADKIAGMTALYATVMALFHRERTGEGQEVEVPMFETMSAFMLVEHANGALFDPPLGPAHYPRAVARDRRPYRTRDGHVAALIYNDKHWRLFTQAVKPEWVTDDMATLAQRATQIDHIYGLLAETFLTRTTQEWLDLLLELGIPAAPLRTTDDLLQDPHLVESGFFQTVPSRWGDMRYPGIPVDFSRTPGRIAGPPPALGEADEEPCDAMTREAQVRS